MGHHLNPRHAGPTPRHRRPRPLPDRLRYRGKPRQAVRAMLRKGVA